MVSSVFVPSICSPFIPSPSHFCFLFSFMSSCLHVWSSSFSSSCVRAFTYLVSGRPGLYNEVGFIGPCALGYPLISTTRTFVPSRPPGHSFVFCAHTCTLALTLALVHADIWPERWSARRTCHFPSLLNGMRLSPEPHR